MPKKSPPAPINQTVTGNENIQVSGSNNVINRISNFFQGDTEARRALRNRHAMLELVKNTWIKGVLEKSLYNEVLIELGMEERPSSVNHPWDLQVHMPNQVNRTLPDGTSITQVFDDANDAMLILGEPGSGKTTMLLELTRDCIDRALLDDNQPIPAVFNLSSWEGRQTIDDWLVNELRTKYNVSKKTAQSWVSNDDLHLLLDGLDEVKQENRDACVNAINDFREKHGLSVPIVVCSRIADYDALTLKLNLSVAVLLQPLSNEQIDEYFRQTGPELERVYQLLKDDQILQTLVKQPLMLSVLTLAYRGTDVNTFLDKGTETIATRRRHLFDTYIRQMFQRAVRTKSTQYNNERTKQWLVWLARKMVESGQSVFYLEYLPKMSEPHIQNIFHLLFFASIFGGFIMIFLFISPEFVFQAGLFFGFWVLWISMILGVAFGLFVMSYFSKGQELNSYYPKEQLTWLWNKPHNSIGIMLLLSFLCCVLISILSQPNLTVILLFLIPYLVIVFLPIGLRLKQKDNLSISQINAETHKLSSKSKIYRLFVRPFDWIQIVVKRRSQLGTPVEVLKWSWQRSWKGFVIGFVIGVVTLLLFFLFILLLRVTLLKDLPDFNVLNEFKDFFQSINPLTSMMLCGTVFGVLGFILYGLSAGELETKSHPNQGIRASLRSVLLVIFLFVGAFGTATAIVFPVIIDIEPIIGFSLMSFVLLFLYGGLTIGLFLGLIFGIFYGGYALFHHFVMRYVLFEGGYIPWKYVRFLDYCVDRIFLRRVGGGYIFVHRLLMEHFADMYPADEK